jgi:hypothetical protein
VADVTAFFNSACEVSSNGASKDITKKTVTADWPFALIAALRACVRLLVVNSRFVLN